MAKKKDNTTSIGFEDAIWRAADKLRGNLNASEYEGVVLGLIFLKYISDKFEANPSTWKMAHMNVAIRGLEANLGQSYADTFFNDQHPMLKADFIMANSQTGGEGDIRQKIVEADLVEGIIALPSQLFYSTGIPVSLWFLSRHKEQPGKVLFIDARNMGTMVTRAVRELMQEDITKIAETFDSFRRGTLEDEAGYCAVKTLEDVKVQDFILTPGRYVGIAEQEDDGEPFDEKMKRLTSELSTLFTESHRLEDEIKKQLGSIGFALNE